MTGPPRWTTGTLDQIVRLCREHRRIRCSWCGRTPLATVYVTNDGFVVRFGCYPCWPAHWTGSGRFVTGKLVRVAKLAIDDRPWALTWEELFESLPAAFFAPFPVPPSPRALPPIPPPRTRGRYLPTEPAGQIRVWLA